MENTPVKLELPLGMVNVIMEHLGNGQYGKVVEVIESIRKQVLPQIQKPEVPQAE